MKYENIKVGQLVSYPGKEYVKSFNGASSRGISLQPDIGVVVSVTEVELSVVDVFWHRDNTCLPVESFAIDLLADVI